MPTAPNDAPRHRWFWRNMVPRLRFPSLVQRGLPIVGATLLSRPLGYIRVGVQAWWFGATAEMDAFVLAFAVPSILQVVLLTGPLSGVLVPLLTTYRHDRQAFNATFNSLFTLSSLLSLTIAGLAAAVAPVLMAIAGPGLASHMRELATFLFRLMLPMLVMQGLLSVCKGALNTLDHYGAPEYAGAVFNVVMIAAVLLFAPYLGIVSLALGAALGGIVQLGMQFPFLIRHGVHYRPSLRFNVNIQQFVRLVRGAFISTTITPLNALIDRSLASLLFPGAVAALNYAFLLFLLPASLFVVPLSTVLLTDLAHLYHQGDITTLRRRAMSALRLVFILTIPATVVGMVFSYPLTRMVYEYGHFHAADTQLTSQALWAYMLGLPFYGGVHLLTRCFYAMQDTMTPAVISIGALLLNIICDVVFMRLFSHWGIALASAIVLCATAITLYIVFHWRCTQHVALASKCPGPSLFDSTGEVE
jgi:putative peptidoglycan lipid II flippase